MRTETTQRMPLDWRGKGSVFVVVAACHVAALIAMSHWTGVRPALEAPALQVRLLPAATPAPLELPPPPLPKFEPPVIEVPEPEVRIDWRVEPSPLRVAIRSASLPPLVYSGDVPRLVSHVEYAVPPQPVYPLAARKRREQGLVILKVLVDEQGAAAAVEVHASSGYPLLDSAARDAVRRSQFRPRRENGVARAVFVLLPIEFGLNNHGSRVQRGAARGETGRLSS